MTKTTRLMDRLFSATDEKDEELTAQVANDIEDAKANGEVDTDELKYEHVGDGKVAITDKENGEVTVAEKAEDGNYDLYPAEQSTQIEGFIHPEGDGVTPGQQVGAPDENIESHLGGSGVAELPETAAPVVETAAEGGNCPECGKNPCECGGERTFSVATDNEAVLRIFSDQEFCERLFSEVIESEETAKVGDLKVEKDPDEENTVIVTSESTGDQARVSLDNDEMEVTELDSKNFSEGEPMHGEDGEEQYLPLHIVGVDAGNHVLVDTVEYDEEEAQAVAQHLTEIGVDGVEIIPDTEAARDYAMNLLSNLGVESEEDIEEPEQAEFSDHTIYLTKYYSNHTVYMDRLFSEVCNDVEVSQAAVEDAIENGDQIEKEGEIITPIDAHSAVVEDKDNGEFTKVTLVGDNMKCDPISESEAKDLTDDLVTDGNEVDEDEPEEKEYSEIYDDENDERMFSDVYCDEDETRFFSEHEEFTDYMIRLFSGDADEAEIEKAIENGDQIENDTEVITPVDATTAVIEDKESGEFTKAVMDDDKLDINPISEEEADKLTDDLAVEDKDEDEDEKEFSDVYCDEDETRFFSEHEEFTAYMTRLFSGDADEKEIESAIEEGEQVENDTEVITPVDATTAVIEDKETGEFTKAVMDDEKLDINPISEEEADSLTEDLAVEDKKEEEKPEEDGEKKFSIEGDPIMSKFFADIQAAAPGQPVVAPAQAPAQAPVPVEAVPADGQVMVDENGNPIDPNAAPAPTVEEIEDKALAAVQSIQAAAAEAESQILNAKAAPAPEAEADLQEAQFSESEKTFSETNNDTLVTWLNSNFKN